MPDMTATWEPRIRKTAAAHKRAKAALKRAREALDRDMATAMDEGASLRDLGTITGLNHETIRTSVGRVNEQRQEQPTDA